MFEHFRRSHKAKKKSSSVEVIKQVKPPLCDAKHLNSIALGKGKVFGFQGDHHPTADLDLSVWLDPLYMPKGIYTNIQDSGFCNQKDHPIIFYPIRDRSVPKDEGSFIKLIDYLCDRLDKGAVIGVSCIGGHGRTGLLLACLYRCYYQDCVDPIKAIRAIGCSKWVECEAQAQYIFDLIGFPMPDEYKDPVFKTYNLALGEIQKYASQNYYGAHRSIFEYESGL